MSQMYTIIAIVGFTLAGVLAVTAVVMFFTLHIKQVRDDLTGKTAARSIAEIRSRAKTRKRVSSATVKSLGWEPEVSSGELAEFAQDEDDFATSQLIDDDPTTSLLADDEPATLLLATVDGPAEGETATTFLEEGEPVVVTGGAR